MYILKNAWINITRNKGRNILIGIIIFVLSATSSIALAIRNSANEIVDAYKNKYNIESTITMDRRSLMDKFRGDENEDKKTPEEMIETFNNIDSLSVDEIEKYGKSSYVKNYRYEYDLGVNAKDLQEATDSLVKETTTVETETNTRTETFGQAPPDGDGPPPDGEWGNKTTTNKKTTTKKTERIFNDKTSNGAFKLLGYKSYDAMTDFVDGKLKITDGAVSDDFKSNNCVISEELAKLNDLEVGSTITITSPNDENITYELIVSGIFKESSDDSDNMANMFSNTANSIITNENVVKEFLNLDSSLKATITPTYILKDEDSVAKFAKEVSTKGLSEYYTVSDNLDIVSNSTKSVNNVKTFATMFLLISFAIGAIVLFVINLINIRERKYEIGVLRTIGMSKIKVIKQFVVELMIVAILSLILGAAVGSAGSVKVANKLLSNEITSSKQDMKKIDDNFGGEGKTENKVDGGPDENSRKNMGVVNVEQIDNIKAVVDFEVLAELLGIGLALTIIGSISACISISRFSPLNILKERS